MVVAGIKGGRCGYVKTALDRVAVPGKDEKGVVNRDSEK
jgi:hypothetical protein